MTKPREERRPRRHRRRRSHHRQESRSPKAAAYEELDDALLAPEERVLRDARRNADDKVDATREAILFSILTLMLLIFVFPVGLFVLIFWGRHHMKRAYRLWIEPEMRERFMREEVQKQVHAHLSHERQELHGEHSRSMQELSASIAHEIRNPITAAKSLVQQMEEEPSARENVEYARVALEELSRVERSVSHLLKFARDEEMRVSVVRLSDVIDSALETFRDRFQRSGVELAKQIDSAGEMHGDPEKLRRIVINLIGNAIDALDEGGRQGGRIDIQMGENLAGSEIWLRIADNGPGIDAEVLPKMFSPFYTSKANGTGLGLSICKKLVDGHGGTIEVRSELGSGAEFLISFPKRIGQGGLES